MGYDKEKCGTEWWPKVHLQMSLAIQRLALWFSFPLTRHSKLYPLQVTWMCRHSPAGYSGFHRKCLLCGLAANWKSLQPPVWLGASLLWASLSQGQLCGLTKVTMKLMGSWCCDWGHFPVSLTGMREEMSLGRQEAFEIFKRDHADSVTIEDNKQILKQR